MPRTRPFGPSRAHALAAAALLALLSCLLPSSQTAAHAQSGETVAEMEQKVSDLMRQQKYTDALPLLEKLVIAEPSNARIHFYLGFALIGQSKNTADPAARKALSMR